MSENRRSVSVTIKYGKEEDEPCAVFEGTPQQIREDIIEYFGMPRESVEGLPLNEVVVNATRTAQALDLIRSQLGGVIIPQPEAKPASGPEPADPWAAASGTAKSDPPWDPDPAPNAEPPNPNAWILGEIEKQTTVEGLKKLWAENQAMFADSSVLAAWKARGKSLR
ncbi:hypothetical protein [Actinocorallia libanotica]|uniref:Lsr2 protein n=1 Tax=Actinocorallia libanotica TaxID=46162 RepID=A0ABP4CHU9_9ACTN